VPVYWGTKIESARVTCYLRFPTRLELNRSLGAHLRVSTGIDALCPLECGGGVLPQPDRQITQPEKAEKDPLRVTWISNPMIIFAYSTRPQDIKPRN